MAGNMTSQPNISLEKSPYFSEGLDTTNQVFMGLFTFNFFFGVIGNSFVIYICGYKLRQKKYKIIKIIFMLGIIDFISSVANPSLFVYLIYNRYYHWHFGLIGCKLLKSVGPISTTASSGVILFMAIDRYRAIVTPTKQQFKMKFIYWMGALIIFLATFSHVPYMAYLNRVGVECRVVDTDGVFYQLDIAIILVWDIAVLIVFITTGLAIRVALVRTTSKIERSLTGMQLINVRRRDQRVNRLIMAVCFVYILCIFPRDLFHLYFNFKTILNQHYEVDEQLFNINAILKFLSTMNSSVNVFLYAKFNQRFQKEIIKILVDRTCFGRCQRSHDLLAFYSSRDSDRRDGSHGRPSLVHQITIESNI